MTIKPIGDYILVRHLPSERIEDGYGCAIIAEVTGGDNGIPPGTKVVIMDRSSARFVTNGESLYFVDGGNVLAILEP